MWKFVKEGLVIDTITSHTAFCEVEGCKLKSDERSRLIKPGNSSEMPGFGLRGELGLVVAVTSRFSFGKVCFESIFMKIF